MSDGTADPANDAMIARLKAGEWTTFDRNFFEHEMHEAEIAERLMAEGKSAQEAAAVAHQQTLRELGVSQFDLYHPDVIRQYSQWFSDAYLKYHGIE